jgi:predicted transposase YbfD/YdcC
VTSLSREQADASRLLSLLRGRWRIENSVFHVLDVVFGEDASRVRTKQSPSVLAAVRAAALNFLRKLKLPVAATLREHAV